MQKLIFQIRNKVFMIIIKGKEIYYNDEKQKVQMLFPKPSAYVIRTSGPPNQQEMEEYNMCTTEEEIISFVVRDCTKKGAVLIKHERDN